MVPISHQNQLFYIIYFYLSRRITRKEFSINYDFLSISNHSFFNEASKQNKWESRVELRLPWCES